MSDKELLEKAAKAAGVRDDGDGPRVDDVNGFFLRDWNPLTDDGDALKLAVKLDLFEAATLTYEPSEYRADPYAATRRAIVRAAAAIGEAM